MVEAFRLLGCGPALLDVAPTRNHRTLYVAVIGPGPEATDQDCDAARDIGRRLAELGHLVVTGGLGGVMEAASAGAQAAGGCTVGLLPGYDREAGNAFLSVALPTGLGELRNGLVVRCSDVVICVGGSWGTLSEVSLAMRTGVPVIALDGGWSLPAAGAIRASTPDEAVQRAVSALA